VEGENCLRRGTLGFLWCIVFFASACTLYFDPVPGTPLVKENHSSARMVRLGNGKVVVGFRSDSPATLSKFRLAEFSDQPCQSGEQLDWDRSMNWSVKNTLTVVEVEAEAEVETELKAYLFRGHGLYLRPGLMLDIPVSVRGEDECLRLPFTAKGDEILWRAPPNHVEPALAFRVDIPKDTVGGVGSGVTGEVRLLKPWGAWRPYAAMNMGFAFCADGCAGDNDTRPNTLDGLFAHVGIRVGVDYRIPLGASAIEVGPGLGSSVYILSVGPSYTGKRVSEQLSVSGSFRLLVPGKAALGFSPDGRLGHGPELIVAKSVGYGRPGGSEGWSFSFGWVWTNSGPM